MKFEDLFNSSHDEKNENMTCLLKKDILSIKKHEACNGELASKSLIESLSTALKSIKSTYSEDEELSFD